MSFKIILRDPRLPPPGRHILEIAENSTMGDLLNQITTILSLSDDDDVDLILGIPPVTRILAFADLESPITSNGITNNEQIRVQPSALAGTQLQGHGKIKIARKKAASKTHSSPATSSTSRVQIATLHASSSTPAPRQRTSKSTAGTEEDIAEHLISALQGGATSRDKSLRRVFRSAVEGRYNESKAIDRIGSLTDSTYTITQSNAVHLLGTAQSVSSSLLSQITVTYPKDAGQGSRGEHTETVTLIPRQLLHALFETQIHDQDSRESLKPINLAKASPRMFWSLVHEFGSNLRNGYAAMFPAADLSWLGDRRKELSEKAKRNLEQAEETKKRKSTTVSKKRKVAADAESTGTAAGPPGASGKCRPHETISLDDDDDAESASVPPPTAPISSPSMLGAGSASSTPGALSTHPDISKMRERDVQIGLDPLDARLLRQCLSTEFKTLISDSASFAAAIRVCGGSTLRHLADCVAVGRNSDGSTIANLASKLGISHDEADELVATAQSEVYIRGFYALVCGGSRILYRALKAVKCHDVRRLRIWAGVEASLLKLLLAQDPRLEHLTLNRGPLNMCIDHGLTFERLRWMCRICEGFHRECDWFQQFVPMDNAGDSDEEDEGDETDENDSQWQEWRNDHGWKTQNAEFLGCTLRWVHEASVSRLWSEGTVVAFAPTVEDDDVELWKVSCVTSKGKERFQDLERHEVMAGIDMMPR